MNNKKRNREVAEIDDNFLIPILSKPNSYSVNFEKQKWSDFVLISWLYSRPGLPFGVYPLYNEFGESQFKMNLDTKVIGYSCFLHLNKKIHIKV